MLSYATVKEFWYFLDKYKDVKELTDPSLLWGDLKEYQRLLIFDRLLNAPQGSRICEIGGGMCKVFETLLKKFPGKYECWSIDPLEGQGGGPVVENLPWDHDKKVRLVRENFGTFSEKIPGEYFDVLFSLSVMEHIPAEQWERCFQDMARVCRKGALIIHTIDASVDFEISHKMYEMLKLLPGKSDLKLLHPEVDFQSTKPKNDPQTYFVSPAGYARWLHHFPEGRNTLTTGTYVRVTAFNAIYVKQ
jgi:methyltransferase family protein